MIKHLRNIYKYRFLLEVLVKRDLTVKYRRSFLGVMWSILNPLLMMLVITLVFSNIFKFGIDNFPVYYLSGYIIFQFITESTRAALASVIEASPLIKKVYIPKYIFVLQKCTFGIINLGFSFIAALIVILILQVEISITILLIPIPVILAFIFSIGLGMLLATINVFFRDIGHLYSVWITAWFYLTPIIYPFDILPEFVKNVMIFNPAYHYVIYFREVLLYGNIPDFKTQVFCVVYSVLMIIIGITVFKRKQDSFILYI